MISRMAATVSWTASPPRSAWALASLAVRAVSRACWAFRATEASTDCRLPAISWSVAACWCAPCASCCALELSWLLAVETEEVMVRIWLITSESRSTTELIRLARSPSSSPRLIVRAVVEMALVEVLGDVLDLAAADGRTSGRRSSPGRASGRTTTDQDGQSPELVRVDRLVGVLDGDDGQDARSRAPSGAAGRPGRTGANPTSSADLVSRIRDGRNESPLGRARSALLASFLDTCREDTGVESVSKLPVLAPLDDRRVVGSTTRTWALGEVEVAERGEDLPL